MPLVPHPTAVKPFEGGVLGGDDATPTREEVLNPSGGTPQGEGESIRGEEASVLLFLCSVNRPV
eukprot:CAMPEP_0114111770 /NCGR_PEP_ID=MMETSP0043_2-20121206/2028_1 /TAXON_ID=464988 /ORGANISM="Hemiselmis andersenii, Strain CCMP644" /LENGTH=63 /DNA_ID=CAMNT_0001203819 /DNA_START=759 /DNA_END=950 /DNA_ORIENTATION=+